MDYNSTVSRDDCTNPRLYDKIEDCQTKQTVNGTEGVEIFRTLNLKKQFNEPNQELIQNEVKTFRSALENISLKHRAEKTGISSSHYPLVSTRT